MKFRSSVKLRCQNLKLPHHHLVDEPSSIDIFNSGFGVNAVRNLLEVHNMAVAMCGGSPFSKPQGIFSQVPGLFDSEGGSRINASVCIHHRGTGRRSTGLGIHGRLDDRKKLGYGQLFA